MKLRAVVIPLVAIVAVFSTMAFVAGDLWSNDADGTDATNLGNVDITPRSYLAYIAQQNATRPGHGRSLLERLAAAERRAGGRDGETRAGVGGRVRGNGTDRGHGAGAPGSSGSGGVASATAGAAGDVT